MKKFCFILLVIISTVFFVAACGDSENSELGTDTASETDDDTEASTVMGELDGECYPNRTCNDGLVCDVEKNVCIADPGNLTDDSDESDSADSADSADDTDLTDSGDLTEDGDSDDEESNDDEEPAVVVNPCESDPNPCTDAEHSDGICTPSTEHEEGFYCGCVSDLLGNYQWYNGKCRRVVSKHRCEQLAQLAEESFPIPEWASTALEFVCYCFSPDTCLALWEP